MVVFGENNLQDPHPAHSLYVATVWIFACYKISSAEELMLSGQVTKNQ